MSDDRAMHRRVTFDHLLVQGQLAAGAPFRLEVAGGRNPDTPVRFDVEGENGSIRLQGTAARGVQSGRLSMLRHGKPVQVDEGELADMPDAAVNVAGRYAALRDDIRQGTRHAAGFAHAVRLSRLVEDVLDSSERGQWAQPRDWPTG